ncbi:EYxxD motif small membrane protein [Mechercharimyces sp. CAU 1602]|uniref:EYxxD motif small membrane protein n=1 Tax=Mechercharimyces sp. CAU 1602 TaxID=2973933 RepID=UPI0021611A6B|nr:EYxxD motif small membrane protein [Mechercharimyces sp. CAU 1602]MCS1352003.1 hypothetical protein [Mechercharimyces sp. CAU 1602]
MNTMLGKNDLFGFYSWFEFSETLTDYGYIILTVIGSLIVVGIAFYNLKQKAK